MAALFTPPKMPTITPPPQAPSLSDQNIQQPTDDERRYRAMFGRASTIMSDPKANQRGILDRRRMALGTAV